MQALRHVRPGPASGARDERSPRNLSGAPGGWLRSRLDAPLAWLRPRRRDAALPSRKLVPVTKRSPMTMSSSGLQVGCAFLMVSLGAACSSSDVSGSVDGGDAGGSGSSSGSSSGGVSGDDGNGSIDGASTGDDTADASNGADAASSHVGHAVALGMAGGFVILAKSAVSTVPTSAVTGNVGVSPMAATFITGFSLTADATNVFSRSQQVTGTVYAANYAVPTPANLI